MVTSNTAKDFPRTNFIGRVQEQRQFRVALLGLLDHHRLWRETAQNRGPDFNPDQGPTDESYTRIFLLHGIGGIGKSWLTRRCITLAQEAGDTPPPLTLYDDVSVGAPVLEPADLMERLYRQLVTAGYEAELAPYRQALADLPTLANRVNRYRLEHRERWDMLLAQAASLIGQSGTEGFEPERDRPSTAQTTASPAEANLTAKANALLLDRLQEERQLAPAEAELLRNPAAVQAAHFVKVIKQIVRARPVVIALDNLEIVVPLESFIRKALVLPTIHLPLFWLLSGRQNLADERVVQVEGRRRIHKGYRDLLGENPPLVWDMSSFGDADLYEYLEAEAKRRSIPLNIDDQLIAAVKATSSGVPLVVEMVADALFTLDRDEFLENFIIDDKSLLPSSRLEQITSRFLRYCLTRSDDMERVQGLALLHKGADELAIRAVWALSTQQSVAEMMQEMRMRYAFVQPDGLHDAVYGFVRRQLQTLKKQNTVRDRLSRRAVDYYQVRWQQAHKSPGDPALRTQAAAWQALTRSLLNARLWADPDQAVRFFLPRFVEGLGFDRPLADELLRQIEQFLVGDVETLSQSNADLLANLRAGLKDVGLVADEHGPGVVQMIKRLLAAPELEALHVSILHLWQGGWLVGEQRYDEALTAYLSAEEHLPAAATDLRVQLGRAFYRLSGRYLWPEHSSDTAASTAGLKAARRAATLDPDNGDAWYNLGLALESLNQPAEAVPAYRRAIDLEPRPLHYNSLGDAQTKLSQYDEAEAAYRQALKLDPTYAWPYHGLGLIHSERGEYEPAITFYRQALERHDYDLDRAVTWDGLGDVYSALKQYDQAIEAYRQGVKLNPNDALLWSSLGDAYRLQAQAQTVYDTPDYSRAIEAYRRSLEVDGAYAWPYHKLGLIYEERGEYAIALTFYQDALERHQTDPARAISLNSLGEVYTALGRAEEAMSAYRQALELDPDYAAAWNRLGEALSAQARHQEALAAYQRSFELDPDQALPWHNLGNARTALENYDEAIAAYRQALKLDPEDAWSYHNLGFVYHQLGRYDQAIEHYQEAIEGHDDGHGQAVAWDNLGQVYDALDDPDEAISAYRRATVLDADYAWPYHHLGLIYADQGQDEQAIALFQQALEHHQTDEHRALSWNKLGDAYHALGRSEEAIAAYQRVIELNPRYALPWYSLGNVYRSLDRYQEVIEAYRRAIELDPTYAWPYHHLAAMYLERGEYEPAITRFQQALERHEHDTDRAVAWTKLGDAYRALGRRDEAGGAYRQAITLAPDYPWPYHHLGLLYSEYVTPNQVAHLQSALHLYRQAIERHKEKPARADAWHQLGRTYHMLGQVDEALEAYRQAIELAPDEADIWYDLGEAYRALDRLDEAGEAYQQVIGAEPEYAWAYHNLGLIAERRGDDQAALDFYRQAIERHETGPDQALAWDRLGDVYRATDRPIQAIEAYQQAIKLAPAEVRPRQSLGQVYQALNRADEAIQTFQQAIELDPEDARTWNSLGDVYQSQARLAEAEAAFQKAIEIDADYALPYHNLGRLYEEQQQYEAALSFYRQAIERHTLADNQAVAWSELGDVYSTLEQTDKAIAAYQQAIELDPGYAWPYHNLGLVCEQQENYEAAVPCFEQALERHETDTDRVLSRYHLGNVYRALKRPEAAIAAYQQVLDLAPGHARAWNSLGTALTAVERYAEAVAAFERAVELDAEYAWAYHNLGFVYEKQGAHEQAIPYYQQAIERHQTDQDSAVSWNNLGNNHRALERYEQAIKAYRRAINLNPGYALPWDSLGDTYRLLDRDEAAIEAYRRAIELDPTYAWPYHNLGLVYKDQEIHEAAIPLYRQAIERHQTDADQAVSWNNLGNAYSALGQSQAAIEAHRQAIALNPDYAWPYNNLGYVLDQVGEPEQAIPLYRQAIERHETDENRAVSWDNLGKALAALDRYEEAVEAHRRAIDLDGDYALPWYNLGNVYQSQERYPEAIEAYRQAIELDEGYAAPWNGLGEIYRELNQSSEAISAYQRALELDPAYAMPYRNLARLYEQRGEYEVAIIHYQQAIERHDRDEDKAVLWNKVGDAYHALEEPEGAINAYLQAIKLDGKYARPWYNLGHLYTGLGRDEAAVNAFKRAIDLAPTDPWAYHYLGLAYEELEDYKTAAGLFQQAIERHQAGVDQAMSWYSLGNAYSKAYLYTQASEAFRQAIRLDGEYALPWSGLGDVHSSLRQYQPAIDAYRRAIKLDPTHAPAYNNLGFVYEQLGQYEQAMTSYRQVIEQLESPGDQAVAWNNLGNVYLALDRVDEAIAAYEQAVELDPNFIWPYHNLGAIYEQRGQTEQALTFYQRATQQHEGIGD